MLIAVYPSLPPLPPPCVCRPLGVVPGTHLVGHIGGAGGLDPTTIDGRNAVYPLLQPGDALCVGPFVVHGSVANASSTHWRRSFITGFALPDAIRCKPQQDADTGSSASAGMSWFCDRSVPTETACTGVLEAL